MEKLGIFFIGFSYLESSKKYAKNYQPIGMEHFRFRDCLERFKISFGSELINFDIFFYQYLQPVNNY